MNITYLVALRRKRILKIAQRNVRCPLSSVQCGLSTSREPVGGLGFTTQSRIRPNPSSPCPSRETHEQVTSLWGKRGCGDVQGDQGAQNGTGLTRGVGGGSWRGWLLRMSWVGKEEGEGDGKVGRGKDSHSLEPTAVAKVHSAGHLRCCCCSIEFFLLEENLLCCSSQ